MRGALNNRVSYVFYTLNIVFSYIFWKIKINCLISKNFTKDCRVEIIFVTSQIYTSHFMHPCLMVVDSITVILVRELLL